jgi:hypothetical protein
VEPRGSWFRLSERRNAAPVQVLYMSQETKKVRRKVCKKPYSLRNNGTAGGYFLENY